MNTGMYILGAVYIMCVYLFVSKDNEGWEDTMWDAFTAIVALGIWAFIR